MTKLTGPRRLSIALTAAWVGCWMFDIASEFAWRHEFWEVWTKYPMTSLVTFGPPVLCWSVWWVSRGTWRKNDQTS